MYSYDNESDSKSMSDVLNIGIIGCGIGGLACAIYLARAGHEVTLFDKFDAPKPVGSGLVIQPVGQDVLRELGVLETIKARSAPIFNMTGHEAKSGRSVLNVDYGPEDEQTFGLGLHRGAIFMALYDAAKAEPINWKLDTEITQSHLDNDNRTVADNAGHNFGPYDIVIDASGAGSKLSPIKTRDLSYGALWGTVDWPENTSLHPKRLTQCYLRASHMMGILPLGAPREGDKHKAAIFWSEPRAALPDWPNTDIDVWRENAIALWPEYAPFAEQIKSTDDLTPALYAHGTLSKPYHERLAFIGDAAHQASPQLGQGANMALLDARALCQAINAKGVAALPDYARRRRAHVGLYQLFSRVFTPYYQSDSRMLPILRDNIMNPLSRIWPVRPMLTRLVCGSLI